MIEGFFEEIFGTKLFNDLLKDGFDNTVNAEEKEDEGGHSYFHSVKDEYKDGERISHSEKEIKDGKVIKDVVDSAKLSDKSGCKCEGNVCDSNKKCEDKESEILVLTADNKRLSQDLRETKRKLMDQKLKVAELERMLKKVTKDKEYLLDKFERVKNVFDN